MVCEKPLVWNDHKSSEKDGKFMVCEKPLVWNDHKSSEKGGKLMACKKFSFFVLLFQITFGKIPFSTRNFYFVCTHLIEKQV